MSERKPFARLVYLLAALVGWAGLSIEAAVLLPERGLAGTLWHVFGYFTIWTAFGVSVVATLSAFSMQDRACDTKARFLALVAVLLVGVAYSLMLRNRDIPPGLPSLTNHLMHDVLPILFATGWLVDRHGSLSASDARRAMIPPILYFLYAMARGFLTGHYPYWFIDPTVLSPAAFFTMLSALFAGVFLVASGLVWIDGRLAQRAVTDQLSSSSA